MKMLNLVILSILLLSAFYVSARTDAQSGVSVAYQINPAHTGSVQSRGLKPPLSVKWSISLNGTASYPLILSDEIVVIDGGNDSNPSTVKALNLSDGSLLWSQPSPSTGWIGAAYNNGMVFVVNTFGIMSAFSASDGQSLWSEQLPDQYSFSSPPTALNGFVYTAGAGEGGTVYGVKESTGEIVWTAGVQNGDSSAPAIKGSAVYASYICPQTYRFQAKTGKQIWYYAGGCEGGGWRNPGRQWRPPLCARYLRLPDGWNNAQHGDGSAGGWLQ
jgi:outer membrane protein assembly factor BamB